MRVYRAVESSSNGGSVCIECSGISSSGGMACAASAASRRKHGAEQTMKCRAKASAAWRGSET